jgi:NAD-dependent histone deacetylase SIR2/NAD-dependent deacetylase sirtuin 1
VSVFESYPSIFWRFANLIFPLDSLIISGTHYFLEALEERGKFLGVYSQNVGTFEDGIAPEHLK